MVAHLRVRVGRIHLDEGFSTPQGFVGSHSANDHLGDSVEDLALPVVVVSTHLLTVLGV